MFTGLLPNIDWVGHIDWSIRDFHSYETPRGATYNAYLIRDENNAVIDTVKFDFCDYFLRNVAAKVPLDKIDYLVCNHSELDHAGSLPLALKAMPNATLLCNAKCREMLGLYFDTTGWPIRVVTPGETVSLGKRTLAFVDTPMVHWPDSMFTYVPEDGLLFSMDAFGQHLATAARFDDLHDLHELLFEAKVYYANIVVPYGRQVRSTLEKAKTLDITMIAPSHGLIWRKHIPEILAKYRDWSEGVTLPKALILFDTMWHSTEMMAEEILRGAETADPEVDTQFMYVRKTSLTRIATEMLEASAVAIGSATINMQMMPQMAAVLNYLKGLKFAPKTAFAFGSHGWAAAGVEQVDRWIDEAAWPRLRQPIKAKYRPTAEVLAECFEAGQQLALAARKT
ncbi:MAG TPA: MBL fold metallo-hydrolase [Planctomycetaceae bacterium]|nr:MBL fold metallo-hydrolase [Planctomycetaceae bacterium]